MQRLRANSLAVRLTGTLVAALAALLLVSWFVSLSLQRRFSESTARYGAVALAETLAGGLRGMVLANDREGLESSVRAVAKAQPNIRVRVFNKEGSIVYSSIPGEAGRKVDTTSEACFKCHAEGQPIEKLPPGDRTRTFQLDGVLRLIRPVKHGATHLVRHDLDAVREVLAQRADRAERGVHVRDAVDAKRAPDIQAVEDADVVGVP